MPNGLASPTTETLSLTLLGSTLLRRTGANGTDSVVLSSGKPLAMLAFLACNPARTASREQLLELLWSDADSEKGRHTLRQTFWYIRRKLNTDPFATTGDGVRLQVPVNSDRDAFLAALDADEPEAAIQCYGGEFFPDFAAPGGAGFEHWADLERSRLRALFLGAATRVVRERLGRGRAREAISIARRAHDLAPRQQAAWRLLLESYVAADDAVGAALELQRLEHWLADEELEADPTTAQLIKAVRSGRSAVTGSQVDSATEPVGLHAELVGREAEFSELLAAYETAKRGPSRHVHISAPAGLGKTRLLDGFAARLRSARVRVVAVRATPAERSLPYALAAQLTSALVQMRGASAVSPDTARTLVALAPASSSYLTAEPDRSTGDEALRRRSLALTELASTIAHDAPLVLLVDDVHWIDAQSRTLLSALATRLGGGPVLLVTAARHTDRFVDDTPAAQSLSLTPLTVDDVGELVMSIAQLPPEPWADDFVSALHATSGGSPLLVLETLQLVMERSQLHVAEQAWSTPDSNALIAALGAGRAMQQRLAALPAAARDALLRLSTAGIAVDDVALASLIARDGGESLTLLETRGLITRHDGAWRVAHDEIATLSIEMASDVDRARANEALASHLERVASGDISQLLRAAAHRARTPDTSALDRAFARAVRGTRLGGDLTAIRTLAREVLGPNGTTPDIERLVGRLPLALRYGHWRLASGAAIASSLTLLVAALYARNPVPSPAPSPAPDVSLLLLTSDGGAVREFVSLPVFVNELTRSEPLGVASAPSLFPARVLDTVSISDRIGEGEYIGHSLLSSNRVDGFDLVRVSADGDVEQLLHRPHDQTAATISPDHRLVAFLSGEWHANQRSDVALMDRRTGTVRRLTETDAREGAPRWSPEGSRVAFVRSFATRAPAGVCWKTIDGDAERCRALDADHIPTSVLAWDSDHSLLLTATDRSGAQQLLLEFDMDSGNERVVDEGATYYVSDPSGRIVLCLCAVLGLSDEVLAVFSPSNPDRKRVLQHHGRSLRVVNRNLALWTTSQPYLAKISISGPASASMGERLQYRVDGHDAQGRPRGVPTARWRSLDTAIAVAETDGVVHMKARGAARIVVSAGGLHFDTLTVTVRPITHQVALREDWQQPLSRQWIDFGEPRPAIVQSVLRVNGDESLVSGVMSRLGIDASRGAGVRVRTRIPLSVAQWQRLSIGLDFVTSDDSLRAWHRGLQPESWVPERQLRRCAMGAPRAEGGEYVDLIDFSAAGNGVRMQRIPRSITDSAWHSITLQVFADGRCGLAIDSVAVAMSATSILRDRPFRVLIEGQSVGTTVEVGKLEAWSGIRNDIDWDPVQAIPRVTRSMSPRKR